MSKKLAPRFVLVVGSIQEEYPDIPDSAVQDGVTIWDRLHNRPAITIHREYANAICLETTDHYDSPFSSLEEWLNELSPEAMKSEGIE